jgi:hypothetical protein
MEDLLDAARLLKAIDAPVAIYAAPDIAATLKQRAAAPDNDSALFGLPLFVKESLPWGSWAVEYGDRVELFGSTSRFVVTLPKDFFKTKLSFKENKPEL